MLRNVRISSVTLNREMKNFRERWPERNIYLAIEKRLESIARASANNKSVVDWYRECARTTPHVGAEKVYNVGNARNVSPLCVAYAAAAINGTAINGNR